MAVIHQAGTIVHTNKPVPSRPGDGGSPKNRFVLLLSDLEDDGQPVLSLPITTLIRTDLTTITFHLPFNRKNKTGLTEPSVVICDWFFEVCCYDVAGHGGSIRDELLIQITDKISELFDT